MPSIRILMVDDLKDWRRLVRLLLLVRPEWQIVCEVSDGSEAVQKAEELRPDLIVLDIGLPKLNGIEVARQIRRLLPSSKIVFLSQNNSPDVVQAALSTGAQGYVYKADVQRDLQPAIKAVLRGKQFVSSSIKGYIGELMATTDSSARWALKGRGYEFCNCDFGCGCNFGGFPNSKDGSCRAFVGMEFESGSCDGLNLSGLKCAAILDWPKAIHEGHGQCVFIVEPVTTEKQIEALSQIFTGKLGGMPWELLGPTFEIKGLVKANITVEGHGPKSVFRAEDIGEGHGDTFKNPVTGEDYFAKIDLPDGFIWKKGECGQGTFWAKAFGLEIGAEKSNWSLYSFHWTN